MGFYPLSVLVTPAVGVFSSSLSRIIFIVQPYSHRVLIAKWWEQKKISFYTLLNKDRADETLINSILAARLRQKDSFSLNF